MTSSYIAFIDESGDEGFTFNEDGTGSSRWLVLSAAVYRKSNDRAPVSALSAARQRLGQTDRREPFHFNKLRHDSRLVLLDEITKTKFRTVTVVSYKPDIPDPERFQANKWMLYRYLTRLLVERVSWLCRDHRRQGDGDGSVELVFSDRAAMSYDDIRKYLHLLKRQSENDSKISVDWSTIDMAKLRAVQHGQLAGLQVADALATSYFYGMRLNRYGVADPSYMRLLRGHVYRGHKGACFGYGVKFLSKFDSLKEKMPHLDAAFQDW